MLTRGCLTIYELCKCALIVETTVCILVYIISQILFLNYLIFLGLYICILKVFLNMFAYEAQLRSRNLFLGYLLNSKIHGLPISTITDFMALNFQTQNNFLNLSTKLLHHW